MSTQTQAGEQERVVCLGVTDETTPSGYVYVTIRYSDDGRLSLTGVVGPQANGNCRGSCGQIRQPNLIRYEEGWDAASVAHLFVIWERWHLNDMRAGCAHQRALGWNDYTQHPSEPCPTCGYAYGSQWLKEEVPADVLAWLWDRPISRRTPAWH